MTSFNLDEFLPYQLAVLASRVGEEFSAIYKRQFGIDRTEWRIIAHLSQSADPISVRDLCRRVELEKSKISRATTRLHKRGLVHKKASHADKRLIAVTLSETGKNLIEEITPSAEAFEADLKQRLGLYEPGLRKAIDRLLAD